MTKEEYEGRLEELARKVVKAEADIGFLKDNCCSASAIEENIKMRYDMVRLIDAIKGHNARLDKIERLLFIGVGIIIAFQVLGLDDKLKGLFG